MLTNNMKQTRLRTETGEYTAQTIVKVVDRALHILIV